MTASILRRPRTRPDEGVPMFTRIDHVMIYPSPTSSEASRNSRSSVSTSTRAAIILAKALTTRSHSTPSTSRSWRSAIRPNTMRPVVPRRRAGHSPTSSRPAAGFATSLRRATTSQRTWRRCASAASTSAIRSRARGTRPRGRIAMESRALLAPANPLPLIFIQHRRHSKSDAGRCPSRAIIRTASTRSSGSISSPPMRPATRQRTRAYSACRSRHSNAARSSCPTWPCSS